MDIQGLIKAWLDDNKDVLSIRAIEIKLGMPVDTLQKVMQGKRKLPEKWLLPYLKFIDRITEQWLFPSRKYGQYTKLESGDIFSPYFRNQTRKGKRRTANVPKFEKQLQNYFTYMYEFQRETNKMTRLIKEINPNIDSFKHEWRFVAPQSAAEALLELSVLLKNMGITNPEVEQDTEIY